MKTSTRYAPAVPTRSVSMLRFAPLHFKDAWQALYASQPELHSASYLEQREALFEKKMVYADTFERVMCELGHNAKEIPYDVEPLQKSWAREHCVSFDERQWQVSIAEAQIAHHQPEVVFFQDVWGLSSEFRRSLKSRFPFVKIVVVFRGYPYTTPEVLEELRVADLLLVGSPVLFDRCNASGLRPHLFYHSFDEAVLEALDPGGTCHHEADIDFSFMGTSGFGFERDHRSRHETLKTLIREAGLVAWLDEQFSEMFELSGLIACPADLPRGIRVCIYGCGSAGRFLRRLLERVRPDVRIVGFADSKAEGDVDGLPVVPPKRLAANDFADAVLIASFARDAIENELRSHGVDSYRAVLPHLFSTPAPDVSVSDANWLSMKPLRLSNSASCFAPLFGLELYEKMHASKLSFNYHSEPAKGTVDNMRLFQATGVGSCLVTDSGSNLPDLFEPETEVVTYSSLEECLEKVRYLLDHGDVRESIARAGQRRTLRDHSATQRYAEFESLLVDVLSG